ncbi:MAG: thioredoxin family protein [Myxococcota bacterium]|nr:thioredoxin family protein [Myxococcota bacterium]
MSGRSQPRVKAGRRYPACQNLFALTPWPRLSRIGLAWLTLMVLLSPVLSTAEETPWVPSSARAEAGESDGAPRLRARLLIDANRSTIRSVRIGVLFDLDPGWHLYWHNPGDAGIATALTIDVPGAEVGPTQWPFPSTFSEADGAFTTYGYEGRVLLMNDLSLDSRYGKERIVSVEARVLICRTECIPASFSVERPLSEALVNAPENSLITTLFERFEEKLPVDPAALGVEVEAIYSQSGLRPGDPFEAGLAIRSCVKPEPCTSWQPEPRGGGFFPETEEPARVRSTEQVFQWVGTPNWVLELTGEIDPDFDPTRQNSALAPRLRGVLTVRNNENVVKAVRVDLRLPVVGAKASATVFGRPWRTADEKAPFGSNLGILQAAALALLGGLILNLMPCVLPVLAIKVFAIAELSGQNRRSLATQGGAYLAGILASMGALAGIVLALRAGGTQVGWGFQFQSPLFLCLIALVLVAFALNLFGVYEIGLPGGRAPAWGGNRLGPRRSFFEGLLAVVLATPCSAPFLGTAVGFAFASSPAVILIIFLAIGLGLGLPFLLISLLPGTARWLPRPGPWMQTLRISLGFALLATVLWVLWIAGNRAGIQSLIALMSLLLVVAFGLFIYGTVQMRAPRGIRIAAAVALLLFALTGAHWIAPTLMNSANADAAAQQAAEEESWPPWTPAAVQESLRLGRPVLVVFSADWCITCQVNERFVLRSEIVRAALEQEDVQVLKADWTERNEGIRTELARHGRAGVPLYLVYNPADSAHPAILPELLSQDDVVDALRPTSHSQRSLEE